MNQRALEVSHALSVLNQLRAERQSVLETEGMDAWIERLEQEALSFFQGEIPEDELRAHLAQSVQESSLPPVLHLEEIVATLRSLPSPEEASRLLRSLLD